VSRSDLSQQRYRQVVTPGFPRPAHEAGELRHLGVGEDAGCQHQCIFTKRPLSSILQFLVLQVPGGIKDLSAVLYKGIGFIRDGVEKGAAGAAGAEGLVGWLLLGGFAIGHLDRSERHL
jgi:hypothetical protein